MTIPEGVRKIGESAFEYSVLTCVTIPESTTAIEGGAFQYCTDLTSVTILADVTEIGYNAFAGCLSLILHAPAWSYVEQYAKENNIRFETTAG